jgi:hypothetical protein
MSLISTLYSLYITNIFHSLHITKLLLIYFTPSIIKYYRPLLSTLYVLTLRSTVYPLLCKMSTTPPLYSYSLLNLWSSVRSLFLLLQNVAHIALSALLSLNYAVFHLFPTFYVVKCHLPLLSLPYFVITLRSSVCPILSRL